MNSGGSDDRLFPPRLINSRSRNGASNICFGSSVNAKFDKSKSILLEDSRRDSKSDMSPK